MAASIPDDGFHEIQLNGKQLVFLFMAATVMSVVIFLCGVLVGRGVRTERSAGSETAAMNDIPADIAPTQPPGPPPAQSSQAQSGDTAAAAAPPVPAEDLTYFKRLEAPKQSPEALKPPSRAAPDTKAAAAAKPAGPAPKDPVRASGATAAAPATAPVSDVRAPAAQGYAVQIAALNVKSEADAIAKRLASKGYSAYVVPSSTGSPSIYRVRIGTFKTRREAESMAARLEKEEQLKPWVTR